MEDSKSRTKRSSDVQWRNIEVVEKRREKIRNLSKRLAGFLVLLTVAAIFHGETRVTVFTHLCSTMPLPGIFLYQLCREVTHIERQYAVWDRQLNERAVPSDAFSPAV